MTTTSTLPRNDLDSLRAAIHGTVRQPGDPDFDLARRPWNLAVDQPVAAVVEAADAADVVATVRAARARGLRVATQPSGHGATGATDPDVILLRTGRLDHVHVDPVRRIARIGAGNPSGRVQAAAARHGLTGLPGSSPVVTTVGSMLGGGLSWFGRRHGWGSDAARGFRVVDAEGRARWVGRTSVGEDAELFWALRGGGGDLAIVTEAEIDLFAAPSVYGGRILWPADRAAEVLGHVRAVTATAPDTLTVWFDLLRFPGAAPMVAVDVTYLGGPDEAAALLRPFDAVTGAIADTRGPIAADALGTITAEPTTPGPGLSRAALLTDLDDGASAALLGSPTDALLSVQVRHLGGALARPGDHGVAGVLPEPYLLYTFGVPTSPSAAEAVARDQTGLLAALDPHLGSRVPFTMLAPGQAAADAFSAGHLDRLRDVKLREDPTGLVRSNFPLGR